MYVTYDSTHVRWLHTHTHTLSELQGNDWGSYTPYMIGKQNNRDKMVMCNVLQDLVLTKTLNFVLLQEIDVKHMDSTEVIDCCPGHPAVYQLNLGSMLH